MRAGNGFAWVGALVTIVAFATAGLFARSPTDDERTVRRALALLPGRAPLVSIVDAQDAKPDVRETLLKLDAFIVRGESVVYVVKQSEVLRAATKGARLCDYMLASIIWHEMTHIKGADETAARRAEQEMWTRFVRDGAVDQLTGMRYLQVLANRTDDQLKTSR